jgi:hypothetical protein
MNPPQKVINAEVTPAVRLKLKTEKMDNFKH